MAYSEHKKGGNCPKSRSSNNQRRTEIKQSSSKFYRKNAKEQIKQEIKELEL